MPGSLLCSPQNIKYLVFVRFSNIDASDSVSTAVPFTIYNRNHWGAVSIATIAYWNVYCAPQLVIVKSNLRNLIVGVWRDSGQK